MDNQIPEHPSCTLKRLDASGLLDASSSPPKGLFHSFCSSTSSSPPLTANPAQLPHFQKRSSGKKDAEEGGASYKYLTWREKDRRRRFREEWKHLWLVVPYGSYEVMCLVCHKIMTQRKLDTIKRHTIRRHAELLSLSEEQRQRLFQDLASESFRNPDAGRPPCCSIGAASPSIISSPLLQTHQKTTCHDALTPKHSRTAPCGAARRTPYPPAARSPRLAGASARLQKCNRDEKKMAGTFNRGKGAAFERFLPQAQTPTMLAKFLTGIRPPPQMYIPGRRDPTFHSPISRNTLANHTCGLGQSTLPAHAFYPVNKRIPHPFPVPTNIPLPLPQVSPLQLDILMDRGPLDMTMPSRDSLSSEGNTSASLTERLMRLVSAWDSAARYHLSIPRPVDIPTPLLLNR